jgi:hypothetical protein
MPGAAPFACWEQRRISSIRIPDEPDRDREYFGNGSGRESEDQVGYLDGSISRFGRSYIGERDVIAEELARVPAVAEADTLLLTVPDQLGVEYNAHLLRTVAEHVAPAIGWRAAP